MNMSCKYLTNSKKLTPEYLDAIDPEHLYSTDTDYFSRTGAGTKWLADPVSRGREAIPWSFRLQKVIETDMSILTKFEIDKYRKQVEEAMLKDLLSWHNLGAWEMAERSTAVNLIDSRWVLKWKLIEGQKAVKARLCVTIVYSRRRNCGHNFLNGPSILWLRR